jgi:hypothetical protein
MKYVNETLQNVGCGIADLPSFLQDRIATLSKLDDAIAEAQAEHEQNPDSESEEKLNDGISYREGYELETCDMIEDWNEEVKRKAKEKAETDAEKKAKDEAEKQNQPPVPPTPPATEKKEKKGIGLGGIILGVAVLAITMGAVNTMRSK